MMGVIAARALTKHYGDVVGVEELSFEVQPGEVFGFLGPNGSGKTTTIRTMLDLIRPTSGSIEVLGADPRREGTALRARVGYLPGELALYDRLTVERLLEDFAAFRGGIDEAHVAWLCERLELAVDKRIGELSHGNKQKVGLVQAFMHRPELLILDEPTQGLDPLVQQTFYALIAEERARGTTVFLSSHVMPEVERICDRVGIIRDGRLATVADVAELTSRRRRRVEIEFEGEAPADGFARLDGVADVAVEGHALSMTVEGAFDPVVKEAARYTVTRFDTREPTLEEVFLAFFGDEDDHEGDAP